MMTSLSFTLRLSETNYRFIHSRGETSFASNFHRSIQVAFPKNFKVLKFFAPPTFNLKTNLAFRVQNSDADAHPHDKSTSTRRFIDLYSPEEKHRSIQVASRRVLQSPKP